MTYKLIGAEVSLYSGKARSYLRRKGIPFEEIPSTRQVYVDEILPRVAWAVIPIVITPEDETLQDTSDIIDALEVRFPERPVFPETPKQRLAALLLEVYGDEWLTLPAMHYRWNHCYDWIVGEFGRASRPDLGENEQRAIGAKNARQFHGMLPGLGVTEAMQSAIERSYEQLLADLDRHFSEHPFLFGGRASIGDYGLIGPLYAHLYRDPYPGDLMRRIAPNVAAWVERMMAENGPADSQGDFLPNDEVPQTLLPVLRRMVDEQFPVLASTIEHTERFIDAPGADASEEADPDGLVPIPRALGMHSFTLGKGGANEVSESRMVMPFNQWMFQRPLDFYQSLDGQQRASCDEMLSQVGGLELMQVKPVCRLERRDFKLVAKHASS